MADWSIGMDKKSARVVARFRRTLPDREIRAGITRVTKRALTRVRKEAVDIIVAALPLKRKFFIGKKGQRRMSGVRTKRGGGVFWLVARNYSLHRLGAVRPIRGGRGGIAQRGRVLTKSIREPRGIVIGRRLFVRWRGQLVPAALEAHATTLRAFITATSAARTDLSNDIQREMSYRMERYTDKIRKA